jgi:ATP-dependent Zn protease
MKAPQIAIIGSHRESIVGEEAKRRQAQDVCIELGRQLAELQFRIVVYSCDPQFIESDVVSGFLEASAPTEKSVIFRHPQSRQTNNFKARDKHPNVFLLTPDESPDREISFYQSLTKVHGGVLLGGGESTLIAGYILLSHDLPIVPIPTFGGSAEKLWTYLSKSAPYKNSQELQAMKFSLEDSAHVCIEGLNKRCLAKINTTETSSDITEIQSLEKSGWYWTKPKFSFNDIAGLDPKIEAEYSNITKVLSQPDSFLRLGARLPRGLIISGPSGVGKTMLAHAIAKKLNHDLCHVVTPALSGPLMGLAAARLANIFEESKRKAPSVLFFDELDVVATRRTNASLGSAVMDANSMVAQFMLEMERLDDASVFVIGATNQIEAIEPAFLRQGRFERHIIIDLPNADSRGSILSLHGEKIQKSEPIDFVKYARLTVGFNGADLAELVNEAAILAGLKEKTEVDENDFCLALSTVRSLMHQHNKNITGVDSGRALFEFIEDTTGFPSFDDIGGLKDAKTRLRVLISFLKDPSRYLKAGCRLPRGILLEGEPGVGKTLLAQAVARQSDATFLYATGASFSGRWVGTGPSRIRDLFRIARRQRPCVIFIDEIDAVGSIRASGFADIGGAVKGYNETLTELLCELDGITSAERVVVLAATNRGDILDPALKRPGRFDETISIDLPNQDEVKEIIRIHLPSSDHHCLTEQEQTTLEAYAQGKTGAYIEEMLNRARILAVYNNRDCITLEDIKKSRGIQDDYDPFVSPAPVVD